jgi:hypothetical protein
MVVSLVASAHLSARTRDRWLLSIESKLAFLSVIPAQAGIHLRFCDLARIKLDAGFHRHDVFT